MRGGPTAFLLLLLLFTLVPAHAEADEVPHRRGLVVEDGGPNRMLVATGVATLGFTYAVSGYVSATSPRASDRWLTVPVAGPWVALARREGCPCGVEPEVRWLVGLDGALQLAGVAQIALAFMKRELHETDRPLVMPVALGGGAGVAAYGTF